MTFSNEPTICIYGEFGVRLEDHMVITETGARWFTEPSLIRSTIPSAWRSRGSAIGRARGLLVGGRPLSVPLPRHFRHGAG